MQLALSHLTLNVAPDTLSLSQIAIQQTNIHNCLSRPFIQPNHYPPLPPSFRPSQAAGSCWICFWKKLPPVVRPTGWRSSGSFRSSATSNGVGCIPSSLTFCAGRGDENFLRSARPPCICSDSTGSACRPRYCNDREQSWGGRGDKSTFMFENAYCMCFSVDWLNAL